MKICVAVFLSISSFSFLAVSARAAAPSMETRLAIDSGEIAGVLLGETHDIRAYKGIPFAAPPVGPNRWREPQPVAPWSQLRACVDYGPACPQPTTATAYGPMAGELSEDCLYLNVFAPAKTHGRMLPVMVWFYGGGFSRGDASFYDMERLARLGVIVVTVNYRLGVFGFLAHPELTRESSVNASGNYGIHDMITALQWVQRNIGVFGGDAKNVTIFGQSSGASAVCHLMASPKTGGLFHRAISQSNGAYNPDLPLRGMEARGAHLFSALGLDHNAGGLAAARAMSWEDILAASGKAQKEHGVRFGINIDGALLTAPTSEIFAQGRQQAVPLLIGSNANESDSEYTAGARYFARQHSKKCPDVFRYFFSQKTKDPRFRGRGAVHAAEIAYVLRGTPRLDAEWDQQDRALSDFIAHAWVQFARNGNPNTETSAAWPRYREGTDLCFELGPVLQTVSGPRAEICDQIDRNMAGLVAKWHDGIF